MQGEEEEPSMLVDPASIIEFSEHKQVLCKDIHFVEKEMESVERLPLSTWQHACSLQTMDTPARCRATYMRQLRTIHVRLKRPLTVSPHEQAFKDDVEQLHADLLQVLQAGVAGIHAICFPRVRHKDRLKPLAGVSLGGKGITKPSETSRKRHRSSTSRT